MAHDSKSMAGWKRAKTLLVFCSAVFLFGGAFPTHAALPAPTLQDPTTGCSGSSPYITLNWSSVAGAASYDVFRDSSPEAFANVTLTTYDDLSVSATESHAYFVKAKNSVDTSPASNSKTVTVPRCGPVLTLAGKSCIASGPKIDFSWNTLAGVTRYDILRAGALITQVDPSQLSYSDITATGGQGYGYVVRAVWPGDTKDSNELTVASPVCPVTLNANGDCNGPGAEASLLWNSLAGVSSYQVFKGGSFLAETTGTLFSDKSVGQKSTYGYFIRALYPSGSADSASVNATIPRCAPVLNAYNTCNATNPTIPEVSLSWTDTADVTLYDIYEAIEGFVQQVTSAPPPVTSKVTSFPDGSKVENGNTYTFSVNAKGAFATLASNSSAVTANCSVAAIPSPAPVLSVTPICVSSDSEMSLSWTPSNGTIFYTIERVNNSTLASETKNVLSSDTSAIDPNVEIGASYTYKVYAVGNGGSIASNAVVKTGADCTIPTVPTLAAPSASCSSGSPLVNLSWAATTNTTKYQIYRGGALINEISNPATVTYQDTAVANSTAYSYEIRAVGPGGTNSSGAPKSVTTANCALPSAPVLSAGAPVCSASGSSLVLSWTPASNVSYYDVYRKKIGEVSFSRIATGLVVTSYTDNGLEQGLSDVSYYVTAVGTGGSTVSNLASRAVPYCPPATPSLSVLAACLSGNPVMNLSWTTSPAGLAASYNFDENSGTVAKDITASNNGTLMNGPVWTAGKFGSALAFDGANDYVKAADKDSLSFTGNRFTLSAWVRLNALNKTQAIFSKGKCGVDWTEYILQINSSNRATASFSPNSSASQTATGATSLALGTWYHIAATYDGSREVVYVNGAEDGSFTTSQSMFNSPADMTIGARDTNSSASCSGDGTVAELNGTIDDARVYNRALTAAEVQADMNTPSGAAGTVSSYSIKRDGAAIGSTVPPTVTFTDSSGIAAGESHTYTVTATGPGGSANSAAITKTVLNCAAPPKPVVSWTAVCSGSYPGIKLTWGPTSGTASYNVYQGATKLTSTPIPYVAGQPSYSYTTSLVTMSANTTYNFTVVANGTTGGVTTSSDNVAAKTSYCAPSKPVITVMTPRCSGSIATFYFIWIDNTPSNTSRYDIRRDGSPTVIASYTPFAGVTSYSHTDTNGGAGFAAGSSHSYTVTTVGPVGSAVSNPVSGTALSCALPSAPSLAAPGLSCAGGKALNFDGVNSYVDLGNPAALKITGSETIEMWVKPVDFALRRNPFAKAYGGEGAITLETDGSISYYYGTCGGDCGVLGSTYTRITSGTNVLSANRWSHIVAVRDFAAAKVRLYINGRKVTDTATPLSSAKVSSNNAYIARGYLPDKFKGGTDEVRVYNRALTDAEVTAHYASGRGEFGAPEAGLAGGWHFEEGAGSAAADYSGGGNTGALMNSPAWADSQVAPSSSGASPFQQVRLDWPSTSNTAYYEVFRNLVKIATVYFNSALPNYSYNDTSYFSTTNVLSAGSTYSYKVSAVNSSSGARADSATQASGALPQCSPTTPFWAPTYPQASCSGTKSAAALNWTYGQPYAQTQNFEIRRDDGSGFVTAATVPSSGTGSQLFNDDNGGAGLSGGTSYTYEINAVGPTGIKTSSERRAAEAMSCSITAPSVSSLCTAPSFNPITSIAWVKTASDTEFRIARKKTSEASFNASYQTVYNYNASSPTMIRDWLVLGTFANNPDPTGYNTDYISSSTGGSQSEATIKPRAGEAVGANSWKRIPVYNSFANSDFVDLERADAFGDASNVVAYAFAYVYSSAAKSGQLRVGSDDGLKVYLNGVKVLDKPGTRPAVRDEDKINVSLNAGVNTILLKISQIGGSWGFYARLTDPAGNPLLSTITTSDSGAPNNEAADYYVWALPSLMTSEVTAAPALNCSPGKPAIALAPACNAAEAVMNLNWGATPYTDFYKVWRGSSAASLSPLAPPSGITTDTNFEDRGVESATRYFYAVEAVGNGSTLSDALSDTTLSCATLPDKPILTPANVTPSCSGTASRVLLDWPDAANAISYAVYRDETAIPPSVTASAFTDGSVIGGATYTYKVQATGAGGSSFSDPVTVKAIDCSGPPTPPVLNSANVLPRTTNVFLTWTDNSPNEEGFRVIRDVAVSGLRAESLLAQVFGWLKILAAVVSPDLSRDTTNYIDAASENTNYSYQIEVFNAAGATRSNSINVFVPISQPGLFNVNALCDVGGTEVTLDWNPGAVTTPLGGTVSYNAYWAESESGSYALLPAPCSPDVTSTSCTAGIPKLAALLWYKVTARNNGGTTDAVVSTACGLPQPKYREVVPR